MKLYMLKYDDEVAFYKKRPKVVTFIDSFFGQPDTWEEVEGKRAGMGACGIATYTGFEPATGVLYEVTITRLGKPEKVKRDRRNKKKGR